MSSNVAMLNITESLSYTGFPSAFYVFSDEYHIL